MTTDANSILMGGKRPPALKFNEIGVVQGGRITQTPEAYQEREYDPLNPGGGNLRFFPSGDPIMGVRVTLATDLREHSDDDGLRTLYIQGQRLKKAVGDAVRDAGANGLEVGGRLDVIYTGPEDATARNPAKGYTAQYTPAAANALNTRDPHTNAPAETPAAGTGAVDPAALKAALANLPPEVQAALAAQQNAA